MIEVRRRMDRLWHMVETSDLGGSHIPSPHPATGTSGTGRSARSAWKGGKSGADDALAAQGRRTEQGVAASLCPGLKDRQRSSRYYDPLFCKPAKLWQISYACESTHFGL